MMMGWRGEEITVRDGGEEVKKWLLEMGLNWLSM